MERLHRLYFFLPSRRFRSSSIFFPTSLFKVFALPCSRDFDRSSLLQTRGRVDPRARKGGDGIGCFEKAREGAIPMKGERERG